MRKTFFAAFLGSILGAILMLLFVIFDPYSVFNFQNDIITLKYSSDITEAVEKVYDSVVFIESKRKNKPGGTGSGLIYKVEGNFMYIATNYHVVKEAISIEIQFTNDLRGNATLMKYSEKDDLAILKLEKIPNAKAADLAIDTELKLGETVFAVGSPNGLGHFNTITCGVISGINRLVEINKEKYKGHLVSVIQTDAAINPGNSGGPLVNIMGEVIGVNTLKFVKAEVEGMGFAIPIDDAMKYAEKLEKGEKIVRPLLGVTLVDIENLFYFPQLKIDKNIKSGAVINEVYDNTPASRAGLKTNDIIIKVNEIEVPNIVYLRYTLYQYNIGDTITLTIIRDGKEIQKQVKLDMALD